MTVTSAVLSLLSLTTTTKEPADFDCVSVPEIAPVAESMLSPAGSVEPDLSEYLYPPEPP